MDFKVQIHCRKCSCSFELRPKDFREKEHLECPNCGKQFPDEVFSHLKKGIQELDLVPEEVPYPPNGVYTGLKEIDFNLSVKEFNITHII